MKMHEMQKVDELSDEFLSTAEVARIFSVTESTVRRWASKRVIPSVQIVSGGKWKFRVRDIRALLEGSEDQSSTGEKGDPKTAQMSRGKSWHLVDNVPLPGLEGVA